MNIYVAHISANLEGLSDGKTFHHEDEMLFTTLEAAQQWCDTQRIFTRGVSLEWTQLDEESYLAVLEKNDCIALVTVKPLFESVAEYNEWANDPRWDDEVLVIAVTQLPEAAQS